MKKTDLIKAADELNSLLFDPARKEEGWIDTDAETADLTFAVKTASLFLYAEDVISDGTVEVLKGMDWKAEDFKNLNEEQDPLPAFHRYGIIKNEEEDEPEKVETAKNFKPRVKVQKEKQPKKEPEKVEEFEEVGEVPQERPKKKPRPKKKEGEFMENPAKVKPARTHTVSAYGMAIALMGPDPNLPLSDLYILMKEQGYDLQSSTGSIKTAHSIFRKVIKTVEINGWKLIKEK